MKEFSGTRAYSYSGFVYHFFTWSNWNLACWVLRRGKNRSTLRKTSRSKGENQQQTQPTCGVDAGNQITAEVFFTAAWVTWLSLFFQTRVVHSIDHFLERFALGNDHFVVVVTSVTREFSVMERCLQGEGDNFKSLFY